LLGQHTLSRIHISYQQHSELKNLCAHTIPDILRLGVEHRLTSDWLLSNIIYINGDGDGDADEYVDVVPAH